MWQQAEAVRRPLLFCPPPLPNPALHPPTRALPLSTPPAALPPPCAPQLDGRRISVTRAVPQSETAPGTPADALRRGQYVPRDAGRQNR